MRAIEKYCGMSTLFLRYSDADNDNDDNAKTGSHPRPCPPFLLPHSPRHDDDVPWPRPSPNSQHDDDGNGHALALSHLLAPTRHGVRASESTLNPHLAVLTFLTSVSKHPETLAILERFFLWGDLAALFASIQNAG
jgi:hypothetical protein